MSTGPAGAAGAARVCPGCGSQLAASFVACPSCGTLVHADELKRLAADAERAERDGDRARALAAWRQALPLLPAGSVQHQRVMAKVQALSGQVSAGAAAPAAAATFGAGVAPPAAGGQARPRGKWMGWAGLGVVGALLLKFKWALLFLLGKGKVLLLGLTKAKTLLSMILTIGLYTAMWGWPFAVGIVVSIYIHEMGHVVWLRRFGIPATAPMFIPGFGAFVRLKQNPATPGEDARVGLAGPVWGAAAAIGALLLGEALDRPMLLAIARVGAWINLFNLIPVWQLDGGRGFSALSRGQRGLVAGLAWLLALAVQDVMFFIVAIAATARVAVKGGPGVPGSAPAKGDRAVLATFLLLLAGLTAIMLAAGSRMPPTRSYGDRIQSHSESIDGSER